jgi:predicted ATPase
MRFTSLTLQNFLSYQAGGIDFGDLTVLVGQNSAGKSNAVTALRLLREIPTYGLSTALARLGGFDQLRHRSEGRPFDPSLSIQFQVDKELPISSYELNLGGVKGKRYVVKSERAEVFGSKHPPLCFERRKHTLRIESSGIDLAGEDLPQEYWPEIPADQSAIPLLLPLGGVQLWEALRSIQMVAINPTRIRDLQEPTLSPDFEPDGSNAASVFERLNPPERRQLVDHLAALVPSVSNIQPRHVGDRITLAFTQTVNGKDRAFSAKQMSDGTLRAFGILVALMKPSTTALLVIEEPETALHVGALRTLVDIFRAYTAGTQIILTTHSADIVDAVDFSEVRVVWSEDGVSRIAPIAAHALDAVQRGLVTPGEMLRSDSLDPATV